MDETTELLPLPEDDSLQALCLGVLCPALAGSKQKGSKVFAHLGPEAGIPSQISAQTVAWAAKTGNLSDTLLLWLLEKGSLLQLPLLDAIAVTDKVLARYPHEKAADLEVVQLGDRFLEAGSLLRKIATAGGSTLRHLALRGCEGIDDGMIKALQKRNHGLESLHLVDCADLTGAFLERLADCCPLLWSLSTSGCAKVTDQSLQAFFQNCSTAVRHPPAALLSAAAAHCPRPLSPSMQHLCALDLSRCGVGGLTAQALGARGAGLQSLTLDGCAGVTDAALRLVLRGTPQLRRASVIGCGALTPSGAWRLVAHPTLESAALQLALRAGAQPLPHAAGSAAAAAAAEQALHWVCLQCTLFNAMEAAACEACGAPRPGAGAGDDAAAAAAAAVAAAAVAAHHHHAHDPYPLTNGDGSGGGGAALLALTIVLSAAPEAAAQQRAPRLALGRLAPLLPHGLRELSLHVDADAGDGSGSSASTSAVVIAAAYGDVAALAERCPRLRALSLRAAQSSLDVSGDAEGTAGAAAAVTDGFVELEELELVGIAALPPSSVLANAAAIGSSKLTTLRLELARTPDADTAAAAITVPEAPPVLLASSHLRALTVAGDPSLSRLLLDCPALTRLDVGSSPALITLDLNAGGGSGGSGSGAGSSSGGSGGGSALTEVSLPRGLDAAGVAALVRAAPQLALLSAPANHALSDGALAVAAGACAALRALSLPGCRGVGAAALARALAAPGFVGLRALTLSHSRALTAATLARLAALPALRTLSISSCHALKGTISPAAKDDGSDADALNASTHSAPSLAGAAAAARSPDSPDVGAEAHDVAAAALDVGWAAAVQFDLSSVEETLYAAEEETGEGDGGGGGGGGGGGDADAASDYDFQCYLGSRLTPLAGKLKLQLQSW
ncbi:hypothetical protein JKP88DRAFT_276316 [Tribonema minus]|uniref:RanBP2-type domain-containing protein n=1 Tax=Tribonema minus TaxID=303371 RepID=A0A835Z4Z5_9STRA|nr:hypothetical protein JKP88DRAFT_276316 [Tribonema minus]